MTKKPVGKTARAVRRVRADIAGGPAPEITARLVAGATTVDVRTGPPDDATVHALSKAALSKVTAGLDVARNGTPLWLPALAKPLAQPVQIGEQQPPPIEAALDATTASRRRRELLRRAPLDAAARRSLLDVLERLLGGGYAHLPLKRARYGFDPVHRVRILRTQCDELDDAQFRAQVNDIVVQLRDLHTVDWAGRGSDVAFLPFVVECCVERDETRYVVTKVLLPPITPAPPDCSPGLGEPTEDTFRTGAEIEYWNSLPIDVAVRRHGEQYASGGRDDSRRALAVASLTHRPLRYYELPDEDWVDIGYREVDAAGRRGRVQWARFFWRILDTRDVDKLRTAADRRLARAARTTPKKAESSRRSINPIAAAIRKAKLLRYATGTLRGEPDKLPEQRARSGPGALLQAIDTPLKKVNASVIQGPAGDTRRYGYLRIHSFDTKRPAAFVDEIARLLRELPQHGLVIDVRDNEGGTINAAEWMLQLLTPHAIEPVRFSVLATDFSRDYCSADNNRAEYEGWLDSLRAAVRSGELYSSAEPISAPEDCNDIGQVYGGPVLLVANACTYSSGDLFCAGFVDNRIGTFVGVDGSTGAGGACVVDYAELLKGASQLAAALPELPDGIDLNMAFLRATRSGTLLGTGIEDVGVPATQKRPLTRRDLLQSNCDLLAHCVDVLSQQPTTAMTAGFARGRGRTLLTVATKAIDRVDVRFDGEACASRSPGRSGRLVFTVPRGTKRVEVCGYQGRGEDAQLRQRRLLLRD